MRTPLLKAVRTLRTRSATASLCLAAALTSAAAAIPDVDVKIQVALAPGPVKAGSKSEAVVTLTPPSGIHINQYPPIRLTLENAPPVIFEHDSYKVGLDAMPDPPEKNPFQTVDPIKVRFRVAPHAADAKVAVKGKVKFFYCVTASGYCAPGTKDVVFTVPVAAGP
jgi:hypothetical protein